MSRGGGGIHFVQEGGWLVHCGCMGLADGESGVYLCGGFVKVIADYVWKTFTADFAACPFGLAGVRELFHGEGSRHVRISGGS